MNSPLSKVLKSPVEAKFIPSLNCSECNEKNFKTKNDLVFHVLFNHLGEKKMNTTTIKDKNQNTMSIPSVRKTLNVPKSTSSSSGSNATKSKSHKSSKQNHPCYMCNLEFHSWPEWKQHAITNHIIPKNPYPKVEMNYVDFQAIMHLKNSKSSPSIMPPARSNSTDSEGGNEQLKLTVCRDNGNYVVKRTMSSPPIAPVTVPPQESIPASTTPIQKTVSNLNTTATVSNASVSSSNQNDNEVEDPDKENITSVETGVLATDDTIITPTTSDLLQKKSSTTSSGAVVFLGTSSTDTDRALAKSASAQTSRMVVIQNDVLQVGEGVEVAVAEGVGTQSSTTSTDDAESGKSASEKIITTESNEQQPSLLRAMISQGYESNNNKALSVDINTILGINSSDDETDNSKSGNTEINENSNTSLNSQQLQQRPASVIISIPRKDNDSTNSKSQVSSRSSSIENPLIVSEEILSPSSEPTLTIDESCENDEDSGNTLTLEESEQIILENGERSESDPLALTEDADDFRCRVCGELFTSDDAVEEHFSKNHFRGIGTNILEPPSPYPATPSSSQTEDPIQERQEQPSSIMEIRRLTQQQPPRPIQDSFFRPYPQVHSSRGPLMPGQQPPRQLLRPDGFPFRPTGGRHSMLSSAPTQVSNSGPFIGNGIRSMQPNQNVSEATQSALRNALSFSMNQTASGDGVRHIVNQPPVRRPSNEMDVPRIDAVTSLSQAHQVQNTRPLSPATQQQLQQQLKQRQDQLNRINAQVLHNQQQQQQQQINQQRNFLSQLQMREAQVRAINAMRMEDRIRQEQASLQQRNSQIRLGQQIPPPPMRPIGTQLLQGPSNNTTLQGKRPMSQEELINHYAKQRRLEGQQQVLTNGAELQQQMRPRPTLVPNPNLIRQQQQQQRTPPLNNSTPERRIGSSITLSVCPTEPAAERSPNLIPSLGSGISIEPSQRSPTFNTSAVASQLAGRGVTITSAQISNEGGNREIIPVHRLPANISIVPNNISERTSPMAQQISPVAAGTSRTTPPNHQFAVPMNPAPRATSSSINNIVDRPERPPTVDLTLEDDAYIGNNSTRRPIPSLRQGITPTRPPSSFSCNLCNVLFNNFASLEDHKLRQHGVRPASFNLGQRTNLPITRTQNPPSSTQTRPSNPIVSNSSTRHLYIPLLDMNRIDVVKMKRLEELGIFSIIPLQGNERSLGATMGIPILNINSNANGNNLPFDCSLPIGPVQSTSNLTHRNGNSSNIIQRQ